MADRPGPIERVNDLLEQRLGIRIKRIRAEEVPAEVPARPPAFAADRLVADPVFLLSSVRSGSTLLRVILNSHSHIHAPHETHFRRLSVGMPTPSVRQAMEVLDLDQHDLEHLLWDRLLQRELLRSGKSVLVEKTPSNVWGVQRLMTAWPGARLVFLLRHPASIAMSWHEADPERRPIDLAVQHTLGYMQKLERARQRYPGLTLRYEDLVADPERETRRITDFLDVPWEAGMLDYGKGQHGEFVAGIGDWRDKIRTGRVQSGRALPAPEEVPERLRAMCATWHY